MEHLRNTHISSAKKGNCDIDCAQCALARRLLRVRNWTKRVGLQAWGGALVGEWHCIPVTLNHSFSPDKTP
jgi:hypothetical protein